MESFGVEVAVLDNDPRRTGNKVNVYGSKKGIDFVDDQENLIWEFAVYSSGKFFCRSFFLAEKEIFWV